MNEPLRSIDAEPEAWLERLTADELSAPERRELFAWLDREPARWRLCALNLLEARELEGALGDWVTEAPADGRHPQCRKTMFPRALRARWRRWLASIACLAMVFAAGAAVEHLRQPARPTLAGAGNRSIGSENSPLDDRSSPPQTAESEEPEPDREPAPSSDAPLIADALAPGRLNDAIPPYVRSQLERRGYRVESEHGITSVKLPDGRNVDVPIDQLRFRYVGRRSY